jgi:hypothetical protein
LIATTMLVAPALAADAVKSTPAAPVAAATTAAPTATPAPSTVTKTVTKAETKPAIKPAIKTETKTDQHLKTFKVAHHHHAHHMTFAKNGKHMGHVKSTKVSEPVKAVTAAPAASTLTPVASTVSKPVVKTIKAGKDVKKIKVAHHHNGRHLSIAKNGQHSTHMKASGPRLLRKCSIQLRTVWALRRPAVDKPQAGRVSRRQIGAPPGLRADS